MIWYDVIVLLFSLNIFSSIFLHLIHVLKQFWTSSNLERCLKIFSKISTGNSFILDWISRENNKRKSSQIRSDIHIMTSSECVVYVFAITHTRWEGCVILNNIFATYLMRPLNSLLDQDSLFTFNKLSCLKLSLLGLPSAHFDRNWKYFLFLPIEKSLAITPRYEEWHF